jgi:UDP-glucose 4-epimerase
MSDNQPVVLVTGANGFVGRHLSPVLVRDGWRVRGTVRTPSSPGKDDVVVKSIEAETDWSAALFGVDAVVHLAARVHRPHEEGAAELYRSINTEGTLNLARQAAKAGVREFIFISTVLVHGRSNDGRSPFSEEDLLTPRGLYGMSKAAAEAGLRAIAQEGKMSITAIRPPLVYGSDAKGNFALLAAAVKRGVPLPFAAIRNHRAFVSVENLTSFIAQRLRKPNGGFDVFLVADAEQVSTPEFVRRMARAAGMRPRLFSVPTPLLSGILTLSSRPDAHDSLIGSLELDTSKAAATGWRPVVTLDEGLQRALSQSDY